jgi:hypothetical protein
VETSRQAAPGFYPYVNADDRQVQAGDNNCRTRYEKLLSVTKKWIMPNN